MKPPAKPLFSGSAARLLLVLIGVVLVTIFFMTLRHPVPPPRHPPVVKVQPLATNLISSPVAQPAVLADNTNFQKRPFPVAYESANNQWTLADGKDTNVIRQLAHNPLEYDRMVEENARIFKRQLVYLKETAAAVFENAKLTGAPVKQLTLPGVDGQELHFEIVKSETRSSRQGMFIGHLAGNLDSMVTLVFMDGREAFTILSPKDNIFIVGEPREDGQVIVKAIDPNTYGVGPAETDDATMSQPTQK